MKTRLYFKQWVQDTLITIELVLIGFLCCMSDSSEAFFEIMIVTGIIITIIALLLEKYGRFEEKEDEE